MASEHFHPKQPAAGLAERMESDKTWLKTNVRKLKNLGLTISLQVSYSLSARGAKVVRRLEQQD